jgi:hypothetical protein
MPPARTVPFLRERNQITMNPTTPATPSAADRELATKLYDEAYHYGNLAAYLECAQYLVADRVASVEAQRMKYNAMPDQLLDVHAICDQRDKAVADLTAAQSRIAALEKELAHWKTVAGYNSACTPRAPKLENAHGVSDYAIDNECGDDFK